MKTKKKITKDIFARKNFAQKESLNRIFKILNRTGSLKFTQLLNSHFCLKKKYSQTKINNRCFITSRANGVYSKITLSRIKIKELINNNLLLGAKKFTW